MGHDAVVTNDDTFPRQKARTRGFQLGRPRSFAIAGTRVLFIRSSGGTDPVGSLWSVDTAVLPLAERLLVDATTLLTTGDLPAQERARRERMREVTSGITAFSLSRDGSHVTFVLSGIMYHLDVTSGTVTELPAPGPVIDPRINPEGTHIVFVSGNGLHLVRLGDSHSTPLCESGDEDETWGLADFIAAEEFDRVRGHWWIDGGLLVERVDNRGVGIHWISDPANPQVAPVSHRYPAAGTPNAVVELWFVTLDGNRTQVTWDVEAFPYLTSVHDGVVLVMSRDQRTAQVLRVEASVPNLKVLASQSDPAWVDVLPGVPRLTKGGALMQIVNDRETDTYRITRDGASVSPKGLQVRALLSADEVSCEFTASAQPDEQCVYRIEFASGTVTTLTDPERWSSAICGDGIRVEVTADALITDTAFTIIVGDSRLPIGSLAEQPLVRIAPNYATVGPSQLRTCVLWPAGHIPGSTKLPVIVSPYGGPHGQRVVRAAGAYATDQWIADQGFAIVIADGRGTPGRGPSWDRAVLTDVAGPVLEDQVEALQALAALHPDLDLDRVGIRGWSFGGYLAALAVMDRPDVFHAAVAGAPVTDWALYDTAYTERYLGNPAESMEAYDRCSLIERADRSTRPLLLIHGLADDNVLAAHTLRLSSALLAAGRPHSVVPLSGVTHMTPQEIVAENLLRLEIDFFRTHLA
jgi:dipeptidyl-peptidase-4